jgi:cell wall-associated NlpC family hydrolase
VPRPYNARMRFALLAAALAAAAFLFNAVHVHAASAASSYTGRTPGRTLYLSTSLRRHYQQRLAWEASRRRSVVRLALRQRGVPYVWGGSSRRGFDCSGLIRWVYGHVGMSLPHYTYTQAHYGYPVGRWSLRPGDVVFFHGRAHVGLYIGGGRVVHAPHPGARVRVASIRYIGGFAGARRLIPDY